MAFVGFNHVVVTNTVVKTVADLSLPTDPHGVRLQATGNDINYTMDGTEVPGGSVGMVLVVGNAPEDFNIDDLKNIKFIASAGDAALEVHYYAGRAIS